MTKLIWMHEDMLRDTHPACRAYPNVPRCVVFDPNYIKQQRYSLKRMVFLLEAAAQLDVTAYQGETVALLGALLKEHGCNTLITGMSPNPWIQQVVEAMRQEAEVELIAEDALSMPELKTIPKRFFPYWNKAKKKVYQPSDTHDHGPSQTELAV